MKLAVVLFNLGGPLTNKDVRPFLFNLFSDYHIIRLPFFIRYPLAWLIAKFRAPIARENYKRIKNNPNGGSPLLQNTKAQARALEKSLQKKYPSVKTFIAMRYWHPFSKETLAQLKEFTPDKVVLLPLYPHYSTTTTESSLSLWKKLSKDKFATYPICCWWNEAGFIDTHSLLLKEAMEKTNEKARHILFSAHSIPQRLVAQGDPYQKQVEASVRLIAERAGLNSRQWSLAYQSRVGRLKWLEPELGAEIRRVAREGGKKTLIIIPISFVSEHIETLMELDIEFRQVAESVGIEHYIRVPTLSTHPKFIETLDGLVHRSLESDVLLCPDEDVCTDIY